MNNFDTIFGSQDNPNLPDLPIPPFVLGDRPMVPSPMVPTVPKFGAQVPVPILVEVTRSPYDLLSEYDMVPSPMVPTVPKFGAQVPVPILVEVARSPYDLLSEYNIVPSTMVPTVPKFGAQVPVPILVEVTRSPYDLLSEYDMVPSPMVVDCFPIARTMDTITFCCNGFTVSDLF